MPWGRAFGRARHSVAAVPGFWMPLWRAARECRPYLLSAWVQHCMAFVSDAMAFHRNALQNSHHLYSSLVWMVIRSVELGCGDEIAKRRFRVGRAHQRFTYEEATESKRLKMTQRLRTF